MMIKGEALTLRLLGGVEPAGAGLGGADRLTALVLLPGGETKAVCFLQCGFCLLRSLGL